VYYGSSTYTSEIDAAANLPYEPFNEVENTKQNAIYLGAILIRNNGDFTNSTSYRILPGGLFRASLGGSGGGGGGGSAVSPFPFTGSAEISGSLYVVGPITGSSFTGSFTGSLFGTSSFATSASFASTESLAPLYTLVSVTSSMLSPYLLTARTASFATTGSNTFIGNQTISGSVNITGSLSTVGVVTQSNGGNNLSSYQEIVYLPGSIPGGGAPTTVITKTGGSPMSMFIEYQLINTITMTDQRSGYIMANFNSSGAPTSTFTETVTADIGNTSMVNFTTNGSPNYDIIATNGGANPFTFKAILRYF